MKSKWHGVTPTQCEVCGEKLTDEFIDGRTQVGFWAIMCIPCHKEFGVGLGVGKGQKYSVKKVKDGEKEWIKVKKMH